jgi:hypothetical protein
MQNVVDAVRQLPDSQVVGTAKEFFNRVYSKVSYDELRANFDSVPQVKPLAQLDNAELRRELPADESIRLARLVLEVSAGDPALGPLVAESIDDVRRSDHLVVDVILALGLLVNLTLLLATTRVKMEKGADGKIVWRIVKESASPEILNSIVAPVVNAAKSLKP